MKTLKKHLFLLMVPLGIALLSIGLFLEHTALSPTWLTVLGYFPYGVIAVGMAFSAGFNRSRIFFVLLLLGTSLLILDDTAPLTFLPGEADPTLFGLLSILMPINICIFSTLKERGFFTFWGLLKFTWIGGQLFLLGWLGLNPHASPAVFLFQPVFPDWVSALFPLPDLGIILNLLALLFLILKAVFFYAYSDTFFMAGQLLIFFPLFLQEPLGFSIFFGSAGLVFLFAIIQDSYQMSYLDELTGLPARRALREDLQKLSGTYTIAMVDIDFFKKFNDRHGHDIGDQVLKMVGNCLSQVTGGGRFYRYGGEEFTIVFNGKKLTDALPHLESLREKVSQRAFILRNPNRDKKPTSQNKAKPSSEKKLYVTISIGAAQKSPTAKDPQMVLKNADKALYRAKKKGRNCVSK